MRQKLKDWMLPIAMLGGAVFHNWIGHLTFLSPYLIFMMLTITYCRLDLNKLRLGRFHIALLCAQMLFATLILVALQPFSHTLATGLFICVFVPTATAAPVITGMLGGSIGHVATYSLLCNLIVAATGPVVLAAIGDHPEYTFLESFRRICTSVMPLLLVPISVASLLSYVWRRGHDYLASNQSLSFYLWAVALFIVVGSSVSFIIRNFDLSHVWLIAALVGGSLAVCVAQFAIGRKVGARYADSISGGQAMGQKNTVLAIWLALTYLNPLASVAPAAYVAWHNCINSWQLIRCHRRQQHAACK
ncbi:MAG: transporter [Muribaculaceae bacterium]|nr:transporter [Muribaculaceae bacterium]